MRILLYVSIITIGAILGYRNLFSDKIIARLSIIQTGCLMILLFIMGINIGVDNNVIQVFLKLGYQALVLSLFSIIFSIAGVKLVAKRITSPKRSECSHDN